VLTGPDGESYIELRSDTFTLPTEAMRRAMAEAPVGDDVWGEDPTVARLEAMGAQRLGKEAGLFVTSGTQANLISVLAHTQPGQELICEARAHLYHYEQGGFARIGGLVARPVPSRYGAPDPDDIRAAIQPHDQHRAVTGVITLENTHNTHGGTCATADQIRAIAAVGKEQDIPLHIDGARIFNAAIALGVDAGELVREADSVAFCFSKGLAAPVGSLVVGTQEFIARARRHRKILGGGMRQAGVIAAPAIVALEQMVDRLAEDHATARRLAETLAELPGIEIDMNTVQTNIIYFDVRRDDMLTFDLVKALAQRKIKAAASLPHRMRLVTHKDVSAEDIEITCQALREILG